MKKFRKSFMSQLFIKSVSRSTCEKQISINFDSKYEYFKASLLEF